MRIYNASRVVPTDAIKPIQAGRLKGKSDINPMWRIKCLTEQFGPVGIGWKYVIAKQWLENGANGEIAAFVNIDLYYRYNGEWSDAIPGTGGSSFVANEKNGPYVSDECFKMALTDAISVSCKALGFGADVYWDKDKTKYTCPKVQDTPLPVELITVDQAITIRDLFNTAKKYNEVAFCKNAKIMKLEDLPSSRYNGAVEHIYAVIAKE